MAELDHAALRAFLLDAFSFADLRRFTVDLDSDRQLQAGLPSTDQASYTYELVQAVDRRGALSGAHGEDFLELLRERRPLRVQDIDGIERSHSAPPIPGVATRPRQPIRDEVAAPSPPP